MSALAALTLDPDEGELRVEAEQLSAILRAPAHRARVIGPSGEEVELPTAIFEALATIAEALRRGDGVSVIPLRQLLTTSQAAELLNISRPYLLTLLRKGEIPFQYVGTHRRLRLGDILAYRERREGDRKDALKNLVRQAEDLGLPY